MLRAEANAAFKRRDYGAAVGALRLRFAFVHRPCSSSPSSTHNDQQQQQTNHQISTRKPSPARPPTTPCTATAASRA